MTQRRPEDLVSLFADEADDVCSPDVLLSRVSDARRGALPRDTVATAAVGEPNRRGPRRWAWALGAAVLVAAVSIGVSQLGGSGHPAANRGGGRPTAGANADPYASLPPYPAHPAEATRRQLTSVLGRFPTLPGAQRRGSDPTNKLGSPSSVPGSGDFVDVHRWWVAPGTMSTALAYVGRHLPAGFSADGNGSSGDRSGVFLHSLEFSAGLPRSRFINQPADVQFQVTRLGGGVAVRVDVQATWLPNRSAEEQIINPSSVALTTWIGTPARDRRQHTFGASTAAKLAGIVNGLATFVPHIEHGCPANIGGDRWDLLVFATSRGPIRATVDTFCEAKLAIQADGQAQPALAGSRKLQTAIDTVMKNR